MRWFALALMLSCTLGFVGCDEPEDIIPTITPSSGTTGDGTTGSSGTTGSEMSMNTEMGKVRFVADTSIRVENMMCPYSCWPKVKETLEGQPGVDAVQLAQQPEGTEEGTIALPVVELKLSSDFDSSKALTALQKIDFAGEVLN